MQKLTTFLHHIDNISEWTGKIFSFLLVALTAVILFEVVMRYLFTNPTMWAYETSLYLFGATIMLGGAYALLHGDHVIVDVVYNKLPARTKAILDVVTFIFFLTFVGVLLWKGGDLAWKAFHFMEKTGSAWNPVTWPSRIAIPIGSFLLLIQGLAKFVRDLVTALGRGLA